MSQSKNSSRTKTYLPKNWRVMTAAGFAGVGLACGLAQPALAQWWKLGQGSKSSETAKAGPADNGFAATIRRLQADSRRAAEQGDYAKAVQLAERAAKISEAAAQVVGPARECSPEATSKFLADMRSRREAPTTVVAATAPAPAVTQAAAQAPPAQAVKPAAAPVNPFPAAAEVPPVAPPPVARPQAIAAVPKPTEARKPTRAAAPAQADSASGTQLFGEVRLGNQRPSATAAPTVRPRTAQPAATTEDLLAQSRVAAADGELDQAIELAQQAVDASFAPSLFGPAGATPSTVEASRWKTHLLAQRNSAASPVREQEPVFEPPVKIAQARPEANLNLRPQRTLAAVELPPSPADDEVQPDTETVATIGAEPATTVDPKWTEDLPPAPAPEARSNSRREAIKFSRSVISRSSGWIDADRVETESESKDQPTADIPASNEAEVEPVVEPLPEFTVNLETPATDAAPEQNVDPASSEVDFAAATIEQPAEEVPPQQSTLEPEPAIEESPDMELTPAPAATPQARGPLRMRGGIILISGEAPAKKSADQSSDWTAEPEIAPTRSEHTAQFKDVEPNWITDGSEPADAPVQRFPVQRVLQLRKRLEEASALNPGASKANQAAPQSTATSPKQDAWTAEPDPASSKAAPAEKTDTTPPSLTQPVSPPRGPVKLRERARMQVDAAMETSQASPIPKRPSSTRQSVVGHSQATLWRSVEESGTDDFTPSQASTTSAKATAARDKAPEQPLLSAPVSQVRFETPESNILELPGISPTLPAPGTTLSAPGDSEVPSLAPPPPAQEELPWFDDDSKPGSTQSGTVHKSSFGMIDHLAASLKLPVATLISLFCGGGLVLIGIGLIAVRGILSRRTV